MAINLVEASPIDIQNDLYLRFEFCILDGGLSNLQIGHVYDNHLGKIFGGLLL